MRNLEPHLLRMEKTVIDRLITQAIARARMASRSTFTEVLLRWLPSDAMRADCLWIDLEKLHDDELLLLAEEHT
jgi:hypothetical protein